MASREFVESEQNSSDDELAAGEFSAWLDRSWQAQRLGLEAAVPCGDCTACCTSSQFVHIGREEAETLSRIPAELLFPAPGQPDGNVLMGYDENGHCPMLVGGTCSIYPYRPRTCRTYDCRVLEAAGVTPRDDEQAAIARRIRLWKFSYPTHRDLTQRAAVRAAAVFLRRRAASLPAGFVPRNPTQLAALAIRVHRVFLDRPLSPSTAATEAEDLELAGAVLAANREFEATLPAGTRPRRSGSEHVREGQASETAVLPAVLRAAHLVLDGTPKIFSDPIATSLLEEWSTSQILERQAVLQSPVMRHLRSMFVVRSRLAEDELRKAVDAGASQYVLLGAGLDTFGFRLPPWARSLRIIEVDHPASQEFKRDRVNRAALAIPANLDYCAIDFEATTLEEGLRRSPFDPTVPTYFSWLGVIPYLTHPSIEATLGFVSALPAPATIGFTFVVPDASLTGIDLEASELSAKGAGARGEPWLPRVEPAALKPWLTDLGFDRVEHITPVVCGERFYRGRTDGLSPPVVEQFATAHRGRRDPTQNR